MNNKIYFNIPEYGGLYIDYIILEEAFPILFVLKNYHNDFFISLCYEIKDKQSWILNKVDIKHLVDLFTGKIDLRNIFLYNKNENKIIINMNYDTEYETFQYVSENNLIDMKILFDESDFLDNEDGEYTEYINKLKNCNNENHYVVVIDEKIDFSKIIEKNIEEIENKLLSINELESEVDFYFRLSIIRKNQYNRNMNSLPYFLKKINTFIKIIPNYCTTKNISTKGIQIDSKNMDQFYQIYVGVE
ncbi:hypothetical protein [Brachyspira pulli]|uniref:hypothetical protein n=1 Tax=Brachyspira pulli TaxID=310721 RepID=UPI003004435F